jgi:hypothetical protein
MDKAPEFLEYSLTIKSCGNPSGSFQLSAENDLISMSV